MPTPGLSPATSTEPSPDFATVLNTPDGAEVDGFDFHLGEPAQRPDENHTSIPECWGHRGVSQ